MVMPTSATMDYIVQYGLHLNVNNNKGYDIYNKTYKMKKQLNELKRMQKLAGVLNENIEEGKSSPYYKLGYQIGPNGRRATVDTQSIEYNTIEEKANQLTSLLNDKDLIDFAKGSTDSIGSSRANYEGLQDIASSLLFFNEIKDRLGKTMN